MITALPHTFGLETHFQLIVALMMLIHASFMASNRWTQKFGYFFHILQTPYTETVQHYANFLFVCTLTYLCVTLNIKNSHHKL